MHNSSYYSKLQRVLREVIREVELESSGNFQKALKLVVWEMIDDLYAGRETLDTQVSPLQGSMSAHELSPETNGMYRSYNSPSQPRRREMSSERSVGNKTYTKGMWRGDEVDSGFVGIKGPATFSREKRKEAVIEESPGPGAYNPDLRSVRQTPPRPHIPTSGMRIDLAHYTSPGPAYYTPHSQFLAKRPSPL